MSEQGSVKSFGRFAKMTFRGSVKEGYLKSRI
jgi:hypothetical protein